MSLIFASSFDAASPFGAWNVATGVTSVVGRTLNGANFPTGGNLTKNFAAVGPGATIVSGSALKFEGFSGNPMTFRDAITGTVVAQFRHVSDGRFYIDLSSYLDGVLVVTSGPSVFVINEQEFYFFEFQASITTFTVIPETISTSRVTLEMAATLFINNEPILAGGYTKTTILNNAAIISPQYNQFLFGSSGGGLSFVIDDVYIASNRLGDGSAPPTDATFNIAPTVRVSLTQQLLEVALDISQNPTKEIHLTQQVLEVILNNSPEFISFVKLGVSLFPTFHGTMNLAFKLAMFPINDSPPIPGPTPTPGPPPRRCVPQT